jgi:hypothetical protein
MGDHTHDSYDVYGVAQEHHSHYDIERLIDGLRSDLNGCFERIGHLEARVFDLENPPPPAEEYSGPCSNPPPESCSDAGCPVHGYDDEALEDDDGPDQDEAVRIAETFADAATEYAQQETDHG